MNAHVPQIPNFFERRFALRDRVRFGLAATIAPLIIPFLGLLLTLFSYPEALSSWDIFILSSVTVASYLGFLIFGVPTIFLLHRARRLTLINLTVGGFLGGAASVPLLLLAITPHERTIFPVEFEPYLMFGALGVAVAVTFGLILRAKLR